MYVPMLTSILVLSVLLRVSYGDNSHHGSSCDNTQCKGDICVNGTCPDGCKDGYYGSSCIYNCSIGCLRHKCNDNGTGSGICTDGCIQRHWGETCNSPCPHCLTCSRETGTLCITCTEFHHGDMCEDDCKGTCPTTGCHMNGTCRYDNPVACKDGKYGPKCLKGCSKGCEYDACNRSSGVCLHGCKQGYFGDRCDSSCKPHCKKQICDFKGDCSAGCALGYYGNDCDLQCTTNCRQILCDRGTGDCTNGCKNGYYGAKCNWTCPPDCAVCSKKTGECLQIIVLKGNGNSTAFKEAQVKLPFYMYYVIGSAGMLLLFGSITILLLKRYCRISLKNNQPAKENNPRKLPDPPNQQYKFDYNEINEDDMDPSNQQIRFIPSGAEGSIVPDANLRSDDTGTADSESMVVHPNSLRQTHGQSDATSQRGRKTAASLQREVVIENSLYRKGRHTTYI